MADYEIRPLTSETWDAFAALCERNGGGGFGGCWCCYFHNATSAERRAAGAGDWRGYKERLVNEGNAHAALVFDGEDAIGWCQYGSPAELPGITHRKEVDASGLPAPDYRLGCFFVDRRYRRKGVSEVALGGALALIAGGRRWRRRGVSVRHRGQQGLGVVPLQLHARHVRAGRLQVRAAQGQEPLHHAQGDRPGLASRVATLRVCGRRVFPLARHASSFALSVTGLRRGTRAYGMQR